MPLLSRQALIYAPRRQALLWLQRQSICTNRLRLSILRLTGGISVGESTVGARVRFKDGHVEIGDGVIIGDSVIFEAFAGVTIEDGAKIGQGARVMTTISHDRDLRVGRAIRVPAGADIRPGSTVQPEQP